MRRGLQGRIVKHLLGGTFDEAVLSAAPPHTLNWCIKTLGERGRPDLSQQLFHWMRLSGAANEHSYVKLCEACEAGGVPWQALQAWRNVRRMQSPFRLGPHAAAALLKTFRAAGDLPGARAALEEVQRRGCPINQYAYNVVLRLCADLADADAALALLGELREQAARDPLLRPDVRTYSAVLAAVVASGKWSRASVVHAALQADGVRPDPPLAAQLLSCCAAGGRVEAAEAVMDEMLAEGGRPNLTHWNALLYAYAEAHQYDGCLEAYRRMTGAARQRPDAYTVVALLRAAFHARAGAPAARRALALLEEFGIAMNVEIGTAAICCCRHPDPIGAEGVPAGALAMATSLLEAMRAAGGAAAPNVRTYNAYMLVQRAARDWRGLLETYEVVESAEELEANEVTLGLAVEACRECGQARRAGELEELRDTWLLLHGDRRV